MRSRRDSLVPEGMDERVTGATLLLDLADGGQIVVKVGRARWSLTYEARPAEGLGLDDPVWMAERVWGVEFVPLGPVEPGAGDFRLTYIPEDQPRARFHLIGGPAGGGGLGGQGSQFASGNTVAAAGGGAGGGASGDGGFVAMPARCAACGRLAGADTPPCPRCWMADPDVAAAEAARLRRGEPAYVAEQEAPVSYVPRSPELDRCGACGRIVGSPSAPCRECLDSWRGVNPEGWRGTEARHSPGDPQW